MASYYKRYYRNKYKRYYRNKYGSTRKKSWGNMKAAKEQSDQATFTINIPTTVSTFSMWNNTKTRCYGVFPMNIFDYLRKSEFYQSYANMYDEFKLDRVKVKLLPTSFVIDTEESNAYKTTTVYTAWDRTGIAAQQLHLVTDSYTAGDEKIGTDENADGIRCVVGEDITTYSSAESRTISTASNTTITRWLNPKTMSEKSQWLNTSQLQKWYDDFDDIHCRFYGIPVSDPNNTIIAHMENWATPSSTNTTSTSVLLNASPMTTGNPCYLEEDTQVKFKPTLLVGVYPPTENKTSPTNLVRFNVEIECVCTFRGLRKAKIVA